jgi:tetratricopeptide (TPR) repeat protein
VDCLAVQTEVATRIAQSLASELVPDRMPASRGAIDSTAYQEYLKGRYYWNKPLDEGLDQAVMFFERALRLAPSFGAAQAALARAWIARAEYYRQTPRAALMQAEALAARALDIDPDQYEAYMAQGDARRMLDCDWAGAESAYRRAIALNPSYESAYRGHAMLLSAVGRHAEAIREADRACELDPLCLTVGTTAAWSRYAAGDFDGAAARCRHTIDMDPEFLQARLLLAAAYLQAGRRAEAVAELESATMLTDTSPVLLCCLAHAKGISGAQREAESLIDRVRALERERHVPAYFLAVAYAGIGHVDAALDALDQAWVDRDPARLMMAVEPRLDGLRDDPRYDALLVRAGLVDWRRSGSGVPERRVDRL